MPIKPAERISKLPPYLFAELKRLKRETQQRGIDVIELGEGDPDLPTPEHIVRALAEAAKDPTNHRYPSYNGLLAFRQAVAEWYKKRFDVTLDPEEEVLTIIGAKDGIAHIAWALIDPGDYVLVPNPAYPVYQAQVLFTGGIVYDLPLLAKNDFLPDLSRIASKILSKAKVIFLNYPNNPTGAVAPLEFYRELISFARKHKIIIINDGIYSEITYDGYKPVSLMEIEGAKEVAVEFHSLSKTYNMTGWRIGWACGNREILAGLLKIKTNCDSGVFQAIQYAGIAALTGPQNCVEKNRKIYQERRDILTEGLREVEFKVEKPKATFYLWVPVLSGYDSIGMAKVLLERCSILVTPGIGFGKYGEGYIRFALTAPTERIKEAVKRIKMVEWKKPR
ncbi:MAG: LL-diaminopimelate aminotransferase [Candidatus Edwardsbacteria bacterium]